jgi:hypothetical protein
MMVLELSFLLPWRRKEKKIRGLGCRSQSALKGALANTDDATRREEAREGEGRAGVDSLAT